MQRAFIRHDGELLALIHGMPIQQSLECEFISSPTQECITSVYNIAAAVPEHDPKHLCFVALLMHVNPDGGPAGTVSRARRSVQHAGPQVFQFIGCIVKGAGPTHEEYWTCLLSGMLPARCSACTSSALALIVSKVSTDQVQLIVSNY
jgi:hypothetical protein